MRNPNTTCTICAKPLYKRPKTLVEHGLKAYCSQECYGKSCRVEKFCVICGSSVLSSKNSITCSKACAQTNLTREDRKHCKGRKPNEAAKYGSRSFSKRFIAERGGSCEECGYSVVPVLHIHHIISRSNGGSDTRNNLILVCANCHGEIHAGIRVLRRLGELASQAPC